VTAPVGAFGAAVFDLYGTLVHEFPRAEFYEVVARMAARLGADPAAFGRGWDETAVERQTGVFPGVEENLREICRRLGIAPGAEPLSEALALRAAMYVRWFQPRRGALETLRTLKERGHPVALVSMCAPDTPALWRACELARYVDVEIFSSEVGLRKPDPAIYLAACERLGVQAPDCVYCGDGSYGELTGAGAVGMTAYLIRDPAVDPAAQLRPEGEDWTGPSVTDLRDLLPLLP
jgi:putative hydrolase of the HAD superfamily